MADVAARRAEVQHLRILAGRSHRHEGMAGVVAMLETKMARNAQVVVVTDEAGDEV